MFFLAACGSDCWTTDIFVCPWYSGAPRGSQWPIWRADWPGEDCQEDHAPRPDIAKVWALFCSIAGGHRVTGTIFLSAAIVHVCSFCLPLFLSVNTVYHHTLLPIALVISAFKIFQVVKFTKSFELLSPKCSADTESRYVCCLLFLSDAHTDKAPQ